MGDVATGDYHRGTAKRVYQVKPEISDAYLSALVGWLAGAQARIGLAMGAESAATLDEALMWLLKRAISLGALQVKADTKHEVLRILMGKKK